MFYLAAGPGAAARAGARTNAGGRGEPPRRAARRGASSGSRRPGPGPAAVRAWGLVPWGGDVPANGASLAGERWLEKRGGRNAVG